MKRRPGNRAAFSFSGRGRFYRFGCDFWAHNHARALCEPFRLRCRRGRVACKAPNRSNRWSAMNRLSSLRKPILRHRFAAVATIALIAVAGAAPALGQSDTRELVNRLQRLENDVQTLNREVFRGGAGNAARSPAGAPPAMSGNIAADFEVRLQRLEADMQALTGRYEEAAYQVTQLREQLAKSQADLEFRLNRLEQGQAGSLSATPAPAAPATAEAGKSAAPAAGKPAPHAAEPAAPAPTANSLPSGNDQTQYEYAFNLLRQADYAAAETAFSQFLSANPTSTLAGNAQYWLGETLYVRGKYKESAVAFAEGYQKYPKSNKAPDSLLKLALALSAMKANEDSCAALGELGKRYKDTASPAIMRRADAEKNRLKCK